MPQESWVTVSAFHDKNTLLLPLLSESMAEPSHLGKRKHHSLPDQPTGQPKASRTLHSCLADTCRRATTGPASLGRALAFQDGTRCAIIRAQTPSVLLHPTSKSTCVLQPCLGPEQCFTTDKGVEAIKKHLYCSSQCKKRWKAIYL